MDFVPVASYNNYIDANIMFGRMQEEGFDCWLKDENIVTIDPILTNAVGGIKLMVAESERMKALQWLWEINKEKKSLLSCPKCNSHNWEFVSTPRKPGNWISVLFSFFTNLFTMSSANTIAMPVEKVYHCFDCGSEFEKPVENNPQ
jgi:predicted nucleic-acid-binding Zn-ribbon protein